MEWLISLFINQSQ